MSRRLKTLLVDDEPLALEYLASILATIAVIEIVGTCRNGKEALARLRTGDVELLFLDVQMPGLSGLDVIARLQSDTVPMVVFATAYDRYALEAFDLNAVDYLLKPLDPERVELAVNRAVERQAGRLVIGDKGGIVAAMDLLRRGADAEDFASVSGEELGKLPIKDGGQTHLVDFADIEWIDAAGDYMCVHAGGHTHILRSTMKELEQRLVGNFVRIHRSTIVNLKKVRKVEALPKGESLLHLGDDISLKVSRNFRSGIQHLLA